MSSYQQRLHADHVARKQRLFATPPKPKLICVEPVTLPEPEPVVEAPPEPSIAERLGVLYGEMLRISAKIQILSGQPHHPIAILIKTVANYYRFSDADV